jgi:serine/threonine-protein kinase RsbW
MEITMALELPRDAVSVPISRQVLDSCLATLGVTAGTRADIALALGEACANVIQHAGPGEEYEVRVSAKDWRCTIEVVNTGDRDRAPADGADTVDGLSVSDGSAVNDSPVNGSGRPGDELPAADDDLVAGLPEHGRGLEIIDALTDNLRLTGDGHRGTTVHFEKTLDWVPGAAGAQLLSTDGSA